MTLRHFRIFLTVCNQMNMTKAANILFISQSAVSQAISELEAYYNVRLFERLSRKLYLTHAGETLRGYALHMIHMNEEAEREMRSLNQNGVIRIGASVTIGACVLPKAASSFRKEAPGLTLLVTEDNTAKIELLILSGKLDLGLVEGDVTSSDIVSSAFAEDALVLICGRSHPFFRRRSVAPQELERENFILREAGSGTRKTFETVMSENGLSWTTTWTCNNTDTIKTAVAEGLGVSVISQRAVTQEIKAGILQSIPISGLSFKRQFQLIYHKNKYLTEAMTRFIAFCFRKDGSPAGFSAKMQEKNCARLK
ncbi:MAG: LysR family transcriptional regulator [Oscillospiraceae bacterium]|nr:LysR family transcriptional regulator [Oscillospiraceae bacterium]